MSGPLSNSLTVLADRVRLTFAESDEAEQTAIQKALEAGNLLVEAKAQCSHGTWLSFLSRAGIQERKAQRYMRLAWAGIKSDTVSDLGGLTAALRWAQGLAFPEADEIFMASVDGFTQIDTTAIVYPEGDRFHVAGVDLNEATPHSLFTLKAMSAGPLVWLTLYRILDFRYREMTFKVVPFDVDLIRLCSATDSRAVKAASR